MSLPSIISGRSLPNRSILIFSGAPSAWALQWPLLARYWAIRWPTIWRAMPVDASRVSCTSASAPDVGELHRQGLRLDRDTVKRRRGQLAGGWAGFDLGTRHPACHSLDRWQHF